MLIKLLSFIVGQEVRNLGNPGYWVGLDFFNRRESMHRTMPGIFSKSVKFPKRPSPIPWSISAAIAMVFLYQFAILFPTNPSDDI
uniref:Uncharacterized protein n=1 Tax=Glossina palpalis gambiensis TaxID=67801 RepID=A0A1B0BY66_9MUSC